MVAVASIACRAMFFFFNDTAPTEIYTLSLHDALPISVGESEEGDRTAPAIIVLHGVPRPRPPARAVPRAEPARSTGPPACLRSEEHTSELQSQSNLVCRLLLEKKKTHSTAAWPLYLLR